MKDLEGATPQVEGATPTPKGEAEPTTPKAEPTVRIQDTEEFRKELDKAVGKGLSSINKQLSAQTVEAEKAGKAAKVLDAELKSLQGEFDRLTESQFAEDPEARKAFLDRKAIADERRQAAKERQEAEDARLEVDRDAWKVSMNRKADELVKETGISMEELQDCQTPEEMEVKALKFQLAKPAEEKTIETLKFDSAISSAAGGSEWTEAKISEMRKSPEGIKEFAKHEVEIIKAYREGKVR